MAYKPPGVRVNQITEQGALQTVESELTTCIVGPLYQVFSQEKAGAFDPILGSSQDFSWPSKPIGSIVDLAGTRNGFIDSQRKTIAAYPVSVSLKDLGTNIVTPVSDDDVSAIDQDQFTLADDSASAFKRATIDVHVVLMDGEKFIYKPGGGLTTLNLGDVFSDGGSDFKIESRTSSFLYVNEDDDDFDDPDDLTADSSTIYPDAVDEFITASASPVSGRTRFTYTTGGPFPGSVEINDPVITGKPIVGFNSLSGDLASDMVIQNITFGTGATASDMIGKHIRARNASTNEMFFAKVTDIDTDAGTIDVDVDLGTAADNISDVRIYDGQIGYVTAIADDLSYIDVVTPTILAETDTFCSIITASSSIDVYPRFDVLVDYRVHRRDLANRVFEASSSDELVEAIGSGYSVDYRDELGWAVRKTQLSQPTEAYVQFVPVDLYPDEVSPSGIVSDQDRETGYSQAFEAAEAVETYNIVPIHRSSGINSALQSHVNTMSTVEEGKERRGFIVVDFPLGQTESTTGEIRPGKTSDGVSPLGTEGNKSIFDDNVDFSTGAEVVAGTRVVVTFPEEFAGTYTALDSTTDNELVLSGDPWPLVKEFSVAATATIDTAAGVHNITGAPAGTYAHVEVGDYVELSADPDGGDPVTTYRMRVTSVLSDFTGMTVIDEVPGDITFTSVSVATSTVIRSWGGESSPSVEYYINPLSKSQIINGLVDAKPVNDRRFTTIPNQRARVEIGVDDSGNTVYAWQDGHITAAAIAGKRSGSNSNEEVTNLILGAGIVEIEFGFGYFRASLLNSAAENGYTLIAQDSEDGQPYIRDMLTSRTGAGQVESEEIVTANADWQAKTLRNTFSASPGARLPIITPRLLGIRTMQVYSILESWVESNPPRLTSFTLDDVSQNSTNKRQTDISYTGVQPLAEKEVEITTTLTV